MDAIDNSPIKRPPSPPIEPSLSQVTKLSFASVEMQREMPPLKPAPSLNVNRSDTDSPTMDTSEPSGPKIIEKEKFWEYVEIDEKPRDKKKKRLVSNTVNNNSYEA